MCSIFKAYLRIELVHIGPGAAFAAEPDRAFLFKIADDNPVFMSFTDRNFVHANDFRRRRPNARQLFAHVGFIQFFDAMPIKPHVPRYVMDRHRPAERADLHGKALRVPRVFGQKIKLLSFHAAAPFTVHAAKLKVQMNLVRSTIEIARAVPFSIVKAVMRRSANPAYRFF